MPILVLATATRVIAQPSAADQAADLAALAAEVARLRAEIATLRSEMAAMRHEPALPPPVPTAPVPTTPVLPAPLSQPQAADEAAANAAQVVTPEAFEIVKAQVEQQAQVKVQSGSRMPVRLWGMVLANTYANSGEANWLENPNLVAPPPASGFESGTMSATVRQSRIGMDVGVIPIGSWQASGSLMFDFFGGVPNFQTGTVMGLPRLVYAFGRLEHGGTAVQVGQDHVLLAPRDPTSLAALSFPLLFRAGNLYLRAPQARVEQRLGGLTLAGGIVAPIAGDFTTPYEFAPTAGAGERSERPAAEGRIELGAGTSEARAEAAVGLSAHYGWRRRPSGLEDAWAVALDGNARFGRVGIAGEYYRAENAEVFGGGISQPGRSSGGWFEGRLAVTRRVDVNAGAGIDRPEDARGRLLRSENRSIFGNVIFRLTPEVETSLEYRWLETELGLTGDARANHHVNAVFAVKF